jgi:hypothetical protein
MNPETSFITLFLGNSPSRLSCFLLDVSIVEATSVLVVGEETAYYLKKLVPVGLKERFESFDSKLIFRQAKGWLGGSKSQARQ